MATKRKRTVYSAEDGNTTAVIQSLDNIKFSAKYRRPVTMVPRQAAINKTGTGNISNYAPTVKPPYNTNSLDRFEDCFRSDKLVQNAVIKRTELVIGKHGKVVLDTTEEFDTPDERTAALESVTNNQEYKDAKDKIDKLLVKPAINFHATLKSAVIQAKVYGRSAIEIVGSDEDGLPEALHVLNSKRLANVEIEPQSWEFVGVHYLDLAKGTTGMEDVLPAEGLVYFANRDHHVSPGSLYYGLSELEGVIDGSDSKRIAKQEDIKEIMKSNWAPFLIMKFLNPNISVAQMQEVVNGISPGLPFAHKQDIESQTINLQSDLQKLTDAIDFLNRETLRELGVPGFLGGYEQIANYANSQQVLLSFKEIELEADRTWIKDIVQHQWLNKLFYSLLGIDPEVDKPEVKLSYEFEDVSFETTLDKVKAALLLFDRQLITGEKVLKIAGYDDQIEEYKLLQKQRLEQQQQQQQDMMMMQPDTGIGLEQQSKIDTIAGLNSIPGNQRQPAQLRAYQQQQQGARPIPLSLRSAPSTTVNKRQGSTTVEDTIVEKISDALDKIIES